MYTIIKGLPASFAIFIKEDGVKINLNDGNWTTDIKLRLNTADGEIVEDLLVEESNEGFIVSLTGEQTEKLDHRSTGYVIVTKVSSIDNLTNLRSIIQVIVKNDI